MIELIILQQKVNVTAPHNSNQSFCLSFNHRDYIKMFFPKNMQRFCNCLITKYVYKSTTPFKSEQDKKLVQQFLTIILNSGARFNEEKAFLTQNQKLACLQFVQTNLVPATEEAVAKLHSSTIVYIYNFQRYNFPLTLIASLTIHWIR